MLCLMLAAACRRQQTQQTPSDGAAGQEDREAMDMLQGVWHEELTEEVVFRARGDTVYYPSPDDQPARFSIRGDSLQLGSHHYHILKQTEHTLWFRNQGGEVMKLVKSDEPEDTLAFERQTQRVHSPAQVLKTDDVVSYGGQRYHWYTAVNPTHYRVTKTSYNNEGVAVENIYYDNIIHVCLYKGPTCLFSRDFKKNMYLDQVPADFLEQAVLGNMQYNFTDGSGVHFDTTLCIPDETLCYLVDTVIGFDGQLSMKLLEH